MYKILLLRPLNLMLLALVQMIVAFGIWYPALKSGGASISLNTWDVFLLILCTMIVTASGYVINDYYDQKTDQINKPKRKIVGSKLSEKLVIRLYIELIIFGLVIAAYLAAKIDHIEYILIYLISCFLLWLYSKYLMKFPLFGNLLVAIFSGLFHLLFVLAEYPIDTEQESINRALHVLFGFGLFAFLISFSRELIKDLEDKKGDEKIGYRTLAILLGERATKMISLGILLILFGSLVYWIWDQTIWIILYACVFLFIPVAHLFLQTPKAKTKNEYHELSNCHKLIMASGLIFLIIHAF